MRNYRWIKDEEEGWCIGSVYDDGDIYLTGNDACFKAEDFEEIGEIVTLGFPSVSKCSFDCDNPVYEDGASYCKEHMECDDWT